MKIKKVYYCCPVQGDRSNIEYCYFTVSYLKSIGCKVLTDYIVTDNADDSFAKALGVEKINKTVIREESVKRIYRANCLIADISTGSTGVGMEIELARHRHYVFGGEPMLVLMVYNRKMQKTATWMATGIKCQGHRNTYIRSYRSRFDLKKTLSWFINK